MLQKRSKHPPVEVGSDWRLNPDASRPAADLCVADRVEPRFRSKCDPGLAQACEECPAIEGCRHASIPYLVRPRSSLTRFVNDSTLSRFTTMVGTMICFDAGMNDRSPRAVCAIF